MASGDPSSFLATHPAALASRKGNVYKSFSGLCAAIRTGLRREAILDGEIVILDAEGRPQFYELLRRRGTSQPVFYIFDLLWLDGQDLRARPLIERKHTSSPSSRPPSCTPATSSGMA